MGTKTSRGYVRPTKRNSEATQKRALIEAGAGEVYVEGTGKETWPEFVRSLRPGDTALVVSLGMAAADRDQLRRMIADLAERKIPLREASTGRVLQPGGAATAQMVLDAVDELTSGRRRMTPKEAADKAALRWGTAERTSKATAMRIWRDTRTYPLADTALDHPDMLGWTRPMAQRILGRRWPDYPGGRPRKLKT